MASQISVLQFATPDKANKPKNHQPTAPEKVWERTVKGLESPKGYVGYVCSKGVQGMFGRATYVVGCTAAGAGVGFGFGSASGGLGAVPGTIIGGGVGCAFGVLTTRTYDATKYKKWKNYQNQDNIDALAQALLNEAKLKDGRINRQNLICSLTDKVAFSPVRTPNSPQVYEYDSLKEFIKKHKCDPKDPTMEITEDQILPALAGLGALRGLCNRIIKRKKTAVSDVEREVLKGLNALNTDLDKRVMHVFSTEVTDKLGKFKSGEISMDDFKECVINMNDELNPS